MDLGQTILEAETFWRKFSRVTAIVGSSVMLLATFVVVADVSRRYLFGGPIPGATDSISLLMPYISFFAMSYALVEGNHVRVTILLNRLPVKLWLSADILACIAGVILLGVLTFYGWAHFSQSFLLREELPSLVYLPWYVGKFAMPIGLGVFFIQFLLRLAVNLGRLAGMIEAPEVAAEKVVVD